MNRDDTQTVVTALNAFALPAFQKQEKHSTKQNIHLKVEQKKKKWLINKM